jgi:glycosyltransferase involved in cell wall biosynthesis
MKASVIIPYWNRKEHLLLTLDAILNQSMTLQSYEVIVIDDGSDQSIENLISSDVTLIRTPHLGAAAARNRGIKIAKGEIIIFIDSDILVEETFIENHYNFHAENDKMVALGARFHMDATGAIQSIDTRFKLLERYSKKISDLNHPWFMTYTCNVSLQRKMALTEQFDENYVFWGLEDSEWAYRLYCQGLNFAFLETVNSRHLFHDRTMTPEKFSGWKRNLDYSIKKHPELALLSHFIDVFDPQKKADYFKMYDLFEGKLCNIS